ncbi:MAG: YqaJ viral recombinase family protein [Desulfuromonadales bacterium]|nr:YqaJ viral recombinase family protein [Desulfuromonadales bacterium]
MNAAIEQRTEEWFAARLGKVTASKINDVMARLKNGGEAATRKNYRVQLAVERLTGQKTETFTNGAMQWGIDQEPFAREAYEFIAGTAVEQVGFVDHAHLPMAGCSPDGLIGSDGMCEIKCPNTATHVEWMLAGTIPAEHVNQMLFQMDCCRRQWCDFVSYDPRMPIDLQLFVRRLHRDDAAIEKIRYEVISILDDVAQLVAQLEAIRA